MLHCLSFADIFAVVSLQRLYSPPQDHHQVQQAAFCFNLFDLFYMFIYLKAKFHIYLQYKCI